MRNPTTWMKKYLAPLVGGTVKAVNVSKDGFPIITVIAKDGRTEFKLEVSRDEEGNGPGFVFGLPHPK